MGDRAPNQQQLRAELEALRREVAQLREEQHQRKQTEQALSESEEKFRSLAEQSPNMIFIYRGGRVLYANQICEEVMGYNREEFYAPDFDVLTLIHPDCHDLVRTNLQTHLQGKEMPPYVYTLVTKQGKRLEAIHTTRLIRYDGERAILGVITDITDRKRAEEALRESEQRFRSVTQSATDAIVSADSSGCIISWNSGAQAIFGYTEDEALGKPLLMLMPERYRDAHLQGMRSFLETGESHVIGTSVEMYGLRKDQSEFPLELSITTWTIEEETYFSGIIRDISERRRSDENHRRLATAVEQAGEAIIITDAVGDIQYVNPAFEQITGYTREEAVGRNPRILKSDAQDADFYSRMWETLQRGEVWSARFVNRKKDGSFYEAESTISPVRDASGEIVNYVAVQRDITQEVALEAQLRASQKMEAIGRLSGGIAHDFNNLLTAILGYSHLLLTDLDADDWRNQYVQEIEKAGKRAASLTRQLLAFSRRQILQPEVLNLNSVLADVEKMLRRLIGEDIDLVTLLHPAPVMVEADRGQIEQVIMNLAVNARDAMPHGGRLTLETAEVELDESYASHHIFVQPGPYVMLSVSDNGCGMDAETKARIFDPFFTTKERGKGTGLGLATVYGIVRQSGGNIWAYSEVGFGTTFKIYLPRARSNAEPFSRIQELSPNLSGSETILLVEDDDAVRDVARHFLTQSGYKVLEVGDAGEAIHSCERFRGPIHLMITDVVMPGMSGRELAENLVSLRPEMRVLYVSGYTDNAIVHHGVLDPGTEFLQKPLTQRALLQKVREVLGRGRDGVQGS